MAWCDDDVVAGLEALIDVPRPDERGNAVGLHVLVEVPDPEDVVIASWDAAPSSEADAEGELDGVRVLWSAKPRRAKRPSPGPLCSPDER